MNYEGEAWEWEGEGGVEVDEVCRVAVALRPLAATAWQPWSVLTVRRWRSCRGSTTARSRSYRPRRRGCYWRRPRTLHEVSTLDGIEKYIKTKTKSCYVIQLGS